MERKWAGKMRRFEKIAMIRQVAASHPETASIAEKFSVEPLTDDERVALINVLIDHFCAEGLDADHEPNEFGRMVDDLMEFVTTTELK